MQRTFQPSTTEKEITKIYENQSKTSQITDQDNSKNELIENLKTGIATNITEMSMTLRNQEMLHPPKHLKDYVTEWKQKKWLGNVHPLIKKI